MKKIELLFYTTNPSEKNQGLKHVLWAITDADNMVAYDWGFAVWDGSNWEELEGVPEGFSAKVHSWANTVDPALLLKPTSKIIRL